VLDECCPDLGPHFESIRADARSQPCDGFTGAGLDRQRRRQGFEHTLSVSPCQPAPPCVRRGNGAATLRRKQHGKAVRHHDRARQTTLGCKAAVRFGAIGRIGTQPLDVCAMNLFQEHGPRAGGVGEDSSIGCDGRWIVAHMVTQVETVVRHG
jgi:hypothetical protein